MALRPYKFEIRPVMQQTDEAGNVTGEVSAQPLVAFGLDGLRAFADAFPAKLAEAEQQTETR